MTELTLSRHQAELGRFHETTYSSPAVRAAVDVYADALSVLSDDADGNSITDLENTFFTAVEGLVPQDIDDPRGLLSGIYDRLEGSSPGSHQRNVDQHNAATLLNTVYGRHLGHLRDYWEDGYFPRVGTIKRGEDFYDIYNYQARLDFTGEVRKWRHPQNHAIYYTAIVDRSPVLDSNDDYVPVDPKVPVIVLPNLDHERLVDDNLIAAHMRALRSCVHPSLQVDIPSPESLGLHETRYGSPVRLLVGAAAAMWSLTRLSRTS